MPRCVRPVLISTCVNRVRTLATKNFDFEVPVGGGVSDCYTRVMLKVEELRQSLRIP
ncbi:NADH-quinone oxidoreductase subunit C/D [Kluyvera cryocrescens]|uniref:NADH-quinone oxidoreductase subunit C/D n=1 Tax=Kluyvera cryocrescens TaxID=580 RepID=A0A485AWP9_KLUCR|nr:NADH-quinone oxidoreductase subunit C/D [Kluyvera cryocrescens]